jgi:predicted RNase H-like HicB family nuclease
MLHNQVEILFLVEQDDDGEYTAKAVGQSIYTQASTLDELKKNILDSIGCHFEDEKDAPSIIRLHIVKDEVLYYAKTAT